MALKISTGLANKLMDTGSFKSLFAGGFLDVYSGVQPASADAAASGMKLTTLTLNGDGVTGLHLAAAATNGTLQKEPSESWQGTAAATGTAGWFRFREATDAGSASSTTACRVDGSVSTSGGDMTLGSLTVTVGAPFIISAASFSLPKG